MEKSDLSDAEFKTLVIRMLKELNEDLKNIKKIQPEMKSTLIEIKKNLQGTNSGVDEAEKHISDLEHKEGKSIQSEQQEENRIQKNEDRLTNLWYNFKHTNISIIGVLEGEEEEQEIENYLKT